MHQLKQVTKSMNALNMQAPEERLLLPSMTPQLFRANAAIKKNALVNPIGTRNIALANNPRTF